MRWGSGALSLAQGLGATTIAPRRLRRLARGVRPLRGRPGPTIGHRGGSGRSGSVALLSGCIQDQWFRPVNHAAITLLEMAGYRVDVPAAQTCCGALAAHDGKSGEAHRLAAQNTTALSGYDMVVATAAGCSAHIREYGNWAHGGEAVAESALDITVAVARALEQGLLPRVDGDSGPVAIQDPCHLRHAQRVTAEPRAILAAGGYRVVEIDPAGMCCGAAGLYTLLQPEASQKLADNKAEQIRAVGSTRVASANPGCEMQLRSALDGAYQIAHPIEWYLQAITAGEPIGNVPPVENRH